MISARDGRILFLIKALVALIFISKISLGSFLPLPYSFSYFIFQKGLHPYMNVALCVLFGVPLGILWLRVRERNHLSGFYKLFVMALMLVLTVQTLLQAHYVNRSDSLLMQLGALGTALFMVAIYGVIIPSLWNVQDFVRFIQRWTGVLVLISLVLLIISPAGVYKGGRFIGVFKHIPHMVTCATVGFIFSLGIYSSAQSLKGKLWNAVVLVSSFIAIILTGTRSSAAAAVLALFLIMILHSARSNGGRIFKFAFLSLFLTFTLFFGVQSFEFAQGIATGQASLGNREAQDGVASRWEEVERGLQMFLSEPWLGQGLLSKFSAGDDVGVTNYNAMKDPHNIFISAGVIGGWPSLVLSFIAVIFMIVGSLKALLSADSSKKLVAIYLLSHIPILVIYHVHLSIGGMADRFYWMVFGIVAATVFVNESSQSQSKEDRTVNKGAQAVN